MASWKKVSSYQSPVVSQIEVISSSFKPFKIFTRWFKKLRKLQIPQIRNGLWAADLRERFAEDSSNSAHSSFSLCILVMGCEIPYSIMLLLLLLLLRIRRFLSQLSRVPVLHTFFPSIGGNGGDGGDDTNVFYVGISSHARLRTQCQQSLKGKG